MHDIYIRLPKSYGLNSSLKVSVGFIILMITAKYETKSLRCLYLLIVYPLY